VQAKVRGGSPGGRSETTGVGFVKEVRLNSEAGREREDGVIDGQGGENELQLQRVYIYVNEYIITEF